MPSGPRRDGVIRGALIALGTLAIVDNIVFHWALGFHRFNHSWSHEINLVVEILLVLLGIVMIVLGYTASDRRRLKRWRQP